MDNVCVGGKNLSPNLYYSSTGESAGFWAQAFEKALNFDHFKFDKTLRSFSTPPRQNASDLPTTAVLLHS